MAAENQIWRVEIHEFFPDSPDTPTLCDMQVSLHVAEKQDDSDPFTRFMVELDPFIRKGAAYELNHRILSVSILDMEGPHVFRVWKSEKFTIDRHSMLSNILADVVSGFEDNLDIYNAFTSRDTRCTEAAENTVVCLGKGQPSFIHSHGLAIFVTLDINDPSMPPPEKVQVLEPAKVLRGQSPPPPLHRSTVRDSRRDYRRSYNAPPRRGYNAPPGRGYRGGNGRGYRGAPERGYRSPSRNRSPPYEAREKMAMRRSTRPLEKPQRKRDRTGKLCRAKFLARQALRGNVRPEFEKQSEEVINLSTNRINALKRQLEDAEENLNEFKRLRRQSSSEEVAAPHRRET